jgi:hypothetical protein
VNVPIKGKNGVINDIAYCKTIYGVTHVPATVDAIFGIVASDAYIHFYHQIYDKIKHTRVIECESPQTNIWYLQRHNEWITTDKNFKLNRWNVDPRISDPR